MEGKIIFKANRVASKNPTQLTLDQKQSILSRIDKGEKYSSICEHFAIAKSTISKIKNNREEILDQWKQNWNVDRKRKFYKTEKERINQATFEFFCMCRSKNISVTGWILQEKALGIAKELNHEDFKASSGWLDKFKKRFGISKKILSGESADINPIVVVEWKSKIHTICQGYEASNIFNADETGIFWRQLPAGSLVQKTDKCKGGKFSKDRITVLLCCSFQGEKLKPLVIGKSQRPRAFKQINLASFIVTWKFNTKAWMTRVIFAEWLSDLNKSMILQKRKILLFLDNATSHGHEDFSNVKLVFFPPNMTAEVQPLDQGIINALKLKYRKRFLQSCINKAEVCESALEYSKSVTMIDAVTWIASSWNEITIDTIRKCFFYSGFDSSNCVQNEIQDELALETLSQLITHACPSESGCSPKEYIHFDKHLVVHECDYSNMEDIFKSLIEGLKESSENIEEDDDSEGKNSVEESKTKNEETLNFQEASLCLKRLQSYIMKNYPDLLLEFTHMESRLQEIHANQCLLKKKQTKILDFT